MAFVFILAMLFLSRFLEMKKFVICAILSVICMCALGFNSWGGTTDNDVPLVVETRYNDYVKTQKKKSSAKKQEPKTITMSAMDAVRAAGRLVDMGDYDQAMRILTMMPETNNLPVEIERWYLIAQMAQRQGDYDTAIKIYRKILDDQPDLVKVRYELALCYMAKQQWYRADYHLRLAMAGHDIPPQVKQQMMYYRWIARQNKNWNVWFNFGAAPDNNINQNAGGEECVMTAYGRMCRQLPEPVAAVGYNMTLGGNYEFKLSDHWRWKNDANLYTNIYDKHEFDDLYLSASTGPRYVWNNGDVWLAGVGARRWYGWDRYNWAYGAKLDTNYDWTRKLSTGLSLRFMNNIFDEYGFYMNGQTYSTAARVAYSFNAIQYVILRGGVDRDTAADDIYANWRYNAGIGFGSELPFGFHIYIEPSFSWLNYDEERWIVKNEQFTKLAERDFIQRYAVSLSNSKIDIWGFVPTLTISYTNRDSNIQNRKYDKTTIEFNMQQRF